MVPPAEMRREVGLFFESHQRWLEEMLRDGRKSGAFHLTDSPKRSARLMFGALQGALMVRRTLGDDKQLKNVIHAIRAV